MSQKKRKAETQLSPSNLSEKCPYLSTIDRSSLDFDFEKVCSVSLSPLNVYACLSCGKYFQGRGPQSHAFTHSLQEDHHLFMNLVNQKVYCLPEDYEVNDATLTDIKHNLDPTFDELMLTQIDTLVTPILPLEGKLFFPGIIGLNMIKQGDWLNAVIQSLVRVKPLRNYFLTTTQFKSPLLKKFSRLVRKLFNPKRFKSHLSPHEFVEEVSSASNGKIDVREHTDPLVFLSWLLNTLHSHLCEETGDRSSLVSDCLRGKIRIEETSQEDESVHSVNVVNFFFLSLKLSESPMFKDRQENSIIPQVSLLELLSKFDGSTPQYTVDHSVKKFSIDKLPPYLILHFNRFSRNDFFVEKNPSIVTFSLEDLDMSFYLTKHEKLTKEDIDGMTLKELKQKCSVYKISLEDCKEKFHIVDKLMSFLERQRRKQVFHENASLGAKYDLIANICHEGLQRGDENEPGSDGLIKQDLGTYKVLVQHKPSSKWFTMENLDVDETMTELVPLSQSYIQIWKRK